jgi:hypothetical protein
LSAALLHDHFHPWVMRADTQAKRISATGDHAVSRERGCDLHGDISGRRNSAHARRRVPSLLAIRNPRRCLAPAVALRDRWRSAYAAWGG